MFTIWKQTKRRFFLAGLIAAVGLMLLVPVGAAQPPQVRALLFYSPSCGHCHEVMTEHLPPLIEQYGDQLKILYVDVTGELGQELYRAAVAAYSIPRQRQGVPTLILGQTVLVGSVEIPERLPGLIEQGLAAGGVGWPEVPGLDRALARLGESPYASPATDRETSVLDRLAGDPIGNGLAIAVLGGLLVALGRGAARWGDADARRNTRQEGVPALSPWFLPVVVLGLAAATYLTFVELSGAETLCGPLGDCRAVQSSQYSRLLGLPVAALGVAAYGVMLAAWALVRTDPGLLGDYGRVILAGVALLGSLFSLYLTFLEPFVIGATCIWCLLSASAMGLALVMTAGPARAALGHRLRNNLRSNN